jgi:oligoendopeptidase F
MDVVELRIQELNELEKEAKAPEFESAVDTLNIYSGSLWKS